MKETKFKQTEVGMVPRDWKETYLGNIGLVKMCKRVMKYQTSEKGDIPFYKIGTFGKSPDAYISKDLYHYLKNKYSFPQKGTVLISAAGTIGRTVVYDGKDAFFQDSNIVWLENDESVLTNQYLYYLYQVVEWKTENGGAVSRLYNDNFKITPIAIPSSKKEQQRIANALSDVDTLIANLEKLIAKKKNIKQGAMQQLLTGKKRLPGFGSDERRKECHSERSAKREVEESSGYKMTELGIIPSDWEVKTFGELFDILPNNTLSRAELNEDSGSFKNVHYGDVLVKFPEWIDCSKNTLPFINSGAKFNHTALQDGDVIIADTAEDETVGKSTEIYNVGKMKIVSGLHTIPIRPKKKFASKWLGYFINSACWHDQILPFITGTKVSAISKTAIAETKFFYPAKIDEQTAIANVLSDMDTEIATLETKLAKYRKLKTGMMQQLLTGKIRLL